MRKILCTLIAVVLLSVFLTGSTTSAAEEAPELTTIITPIMEEGVVVSLQVVSYYCLSGETIGLCSVVVDYERFKSAYNLFN